MAKLTLRNGAHKVTEAYMDFERLLDRLDPDGLGSVRRQYFVLRSDGKVLECWSYPKAADSYDRKRSSYSVRGSLKQTSVDEHGMVEAFMRFCRTQARTRGAELHTA